MLSTLEKTVHKLLIGQPYIRKKLKRVYQLGMYTVLPKLKYEGDITRVSPDDGYEYFFGYYDKSPWDATDRYMLALRVKDAYSAVAPLEKAEIVLIDTEADNNLRMIAETSAWNVQQGCMLQWLGPDYSSRIIYNDFRGGKFYAVILDLSDGKEQLINMPVYTVAAHGGLALSLDFSRLHQLRPGYGYANTKEVTLGELCPDTPCIWHVDLQNGHVKPVLRYVDLAGFEPRKEMTGAVHKVNHLMLNPSGRRFMVLHRWFLDGKKYSRLLTCNIDGSDLYNLSDDDFVSHCTWKTDSEILSFLSKKGFGKGYYLVRDMTPEWCRRWENMTEDGHPSYSPDGKFVVTDTYPDRRRVSALYLMMDDKVHRVARFFSPFRYDNNVRCDLHPRWNRAGNKVCFDAAFEGRRGMYVIDIAGKEEKYEQS